MFFEGIGACPICKTKVEVVFTTLFKETAARISQQSHVRDLAI
jgi:hypothetical protein